MPAALRRAAVMTAFWLLAGLLGLIGVGLVLAGLLLYLWAVLPPAAAAAATGAMSLLLAGLLVASTAARRRRPVPDGSPQPKLMDILAELSADRSTMLTTALLAGFVVGRSPRLRRWLMDRLR